MKEPVDHILRPRLPWRDEVRVTECGYNADKVSTLTREAYLERHKNLGKQRAAMVTCMTCADTATRWCTWEEDPRASLHREIEWEGVYGGYWSRSKERGQLLRDELLAIAELIANHRGEFDAHVTATAERRAWVEKKVAHAAASKHQTKRHRL